MIKIHYILTITKDSKEYIIGKVTAENLKEYGFNLRKVYQKILLGWFIMIVFYASIALKM